MPDELIISSENKLFPSEDFHFLRNEGIRIIEKLAGHVWTDYNMHDPGITILEALCYSLTDLGYRTAFDISDIIAGPSTEDNAAENQFYTARQILPCDPVTLIDLRKLIIDTGGVKNAWVEISNDYEILLYLNPAVPAEGGHPAYELGYDFSEGGETLPLKGLYRVLVEYDHAVIAQHKQEQVATDIRKKLHAHRSLCEDFISISSVEYRLFAMEAEVQVNEGADIDKINAQIFDTVQNLFSPSVNFYSLSQMLEKGYAVEEAFEGPLLKHGFIDSKELALSGRNAVAHLSDVIKRILDIKGVIAVKNCLFPIEAQTPFTDFSEWMNDVKRDAKTLKLDIDNSKISFSRSGDRHRTENNKHPDKQKVSAIYSFLQSEKKASKLKEFSDDINIPGGEFMDISNYYPFQYILPAVYGMQEKIIRQDINEDSDDVVQGNDRKTPRIGSEKTEILSRLNNQQKQAFQLRGFLMVFEQLMADYLSQLANTRNLFSFDERIRQTYFPQELQNIHDLEMLFIDYQQYQESLVSIVENEKDFFKRRNTILDHLLARYGEDLQRLSAYSSPSKNGGKEMIRAKTQFLRDYLQISNYRATAFNCADHGQVWDSDNVPGLKKRICRILGIEDFRTKHIGSDWIFIEKKIHANELTRYVVVIKDPGNHQQTLLESNEYETEEEISDILNYILENGFIPGLYDRNAKADKFNYQLKRMNQEQEYGLIAGLSFSSKGNMDTAFQQLISALQEFSKNESFHIIEHVLLRPKIDPQTIPKDAKKTAISSATVELLSIAHINEQSISEETAESVKPYRFTIARVNDNQGSGKQMRRLSLVNEKNAEVLVVEPDFIFTKDITERIERLRNAGADSSNYIEAQNADGYYLFAINDKDRPIGKAKKAFRNKEDMDKEIERLVDFFSYELKLIRDKPENGQISLSESADPYSFQISIFIPDWPVRFRDPGFRHLLEKTIYMETPAHIYPNVYWLDYKQMKDFENVYRPWLENSFNNDIPDTAIMNNLILMINKFRKQQMNA